jgi:DNA repair ATPase RecN
MAVSTAGPELDQLRHRVRQARSRHDQRAGAAREVARQGQAAVARLGAAEHAADMHEKEKLLLTSIGEQQQETVRRQVEELASRAMQVIFGEELTFRLVAGERAGQATLEFVVRSKYADGELDTPVMDARGGGLAAVLGFVLRLVVLLLTEGTRRLLVLDESFAHVSPGYEPQVAEFLREVSQRAGVQIVLVTHSTAYAEYADQRYRFEQRGGKTVVTRGETE